MNRATKRRIRKLTYLLPRWYWLHRVCKLYLDNYNGRNNADMLINGELVVLSCLAPLCNGPIFDVGANKGQWTELILRYSSRAVIHCFEPNSDAHIELTSKQFPENVG